MPFASFFSGGDAIHGFPDVPAYPASHGCVRVSMPEAPWVYTFLYYGAHGLRVTERERASGDSRQAARSQVGLSGSTSRDGGPAVTLGRRRPGGRRPAPVRDTPGRARRLCRTGAGARAVRPSRSCGHSDRSWRRPSAAAARPARRDVCSRVSRRARRDVRLIRALNDCPRCLPMTPLLAVPPSLPAALPRHSQARVGDKRVRCCQAAVRSPSATSGRLALILVCRAHRGRVDRTGEARALLGHAGGERLAPDGERRHDPAERAGACRPATSRYETPRQRRPGAGSSTRSGPPPPAAPPRRSAPRCARRRCSRPTRGRRARPAPRPGPSR